MQKILALATLVISTTAVGQTHAIARDHVFGCKSKDEYQQLVQFAVQKDAEAFKKGMLQGMLAGRCAMFQRGERVHLSDTAVFSGLTSIRKAGETASYWTAMENVR